MRTAQHHVNAYKNQVNNTKSDIQMGLSQMKFERRKQHEERKDTTTHYYCTTGRSDLFTWSNANRIYSKSHYAHTKFNTNVLARNYRNYHDGAENGFNPFIDFWDYQLVQGNRYYNGT
jgi:hypothetical protein